MEKNNYKIVLLSDLKDAIHSTLKGTISLAKMINGTIDLFHVKEPSEVVKYENQLSAKRTINSEFNATDKKIHALLASFSKEYDVKINYSFAFGNPKKEIKEYLTAQQPDIIVLGKRNYKPLNLLGDNITHFILKEYDGAILIIDDKKTIEPNKELSLGLLNSLEHKLNIEFGDDIMEHSLKPLRSFKIIKNSSEVQTNSPSDKNIVEYIFEKGDDSTNNLSKYLALNKIDLLCVDRMKDGTKMKDVKEIIGNLKVSMLLTGRPKYTIQ